MKKKTHTKLKLLCLFALKFIFDFDLVCTQNHQHWAWKRARGSAWVQVKHTDVLCSLSSSSPSFHLPLCLRCCSFCSFIRMSMFSLNLSNCWYFAAVAAAVAYSHVHSKVIQSHGLSVSLSLCVCVCECMALTSHTEASDTSHVHITLHIKWAHWQRTTIPALTYTKPAGTGTPWDAH